MSHIDLHQIRIDMDSTDIILGLINSFSGQSLMSISAPGAPYMTSGIHYATMAPQRCWTLSSILKNYQASLERFEILRAWATDASFVETLNDSCNWAWSVQELILGTRSPDVYHQVQFGMEGLRCLSLKHYLNGYETPASHGRWGAKLRRLRIDHIDLRHLKIDALHWSYYTQLKVLMLQPCPGGQKSLTSGVNKEHVRAIAHDIAGLGLASLRIVMVSRWKFWLDNRFVPPGSPKRKRLWFLDDARRDVEQAELIAREVDERDWAFLEDFSIPAYLERDHLEWNRTGFSHNPTMPDVEMFNNWNVLRLLPETSSSIFGGAGKLSALEEANFAM